jgi:hypothetical protein
MNRAHTLEEIVAAGRAPSVRFLQVRIRRGEIKARKVGRDWKMCDADLEAYIDSLANDYTPPPATEQPVEIAQPVVLRPTAGSLRRHRRGH